MSKALRIAVAALAAIILAGLAPLQVTTSQVQEHRQWADPNAPDGG